MDDACLARDGVPATATAVAATLGTATPRRLALVDDTRQGAVDAPETHRDTVARVP